MRIEGLYASFSPSFEPLTDCPLTDSQRYRDILLLPTLLFQLPRSFPSFFSPIGFLWCSHASYRTTLYFPLPRSVSCPRLPVVGSALDPAGTADRLAHGSYARIGRRLRLA